MGSRRTGNGEESVYAVTEAWVERALKSDDSLFTPGKAIWTPANLAELRRWFLDQPDVSGDNFYAKLERQLAGTRSEVYQLMAEVVFIHFLIIWPEGSGGMRGDTKARNINRILEWSRDPVAIPASLVAALERGIARPGQFFLSTGRPEQLGFLIEIAERLKESLPGVRDFLLGDPWAFKQFAENMDYSSMLMANGANRARAQRYAIYHLLFPDTFEGIVSDDHKTYIAGAFDYLIKEPSGDVDYKLQQIRRSLESEHGDGMNFYLPGIREIWQGWRPSGSGKDDGLDEPDAEVDIATLASELYLPTDFLEKINSLLTDKKQVIFQGPPGTGKTYVARKLAEHIAGSKDRVTLVQFHPSYAYEDFVQGYRPKSSNGGQLTYVLQDGPLLRAAKQAADDESNTKHFLIIDEINRGNLAKVFGELYFLLEYRNEDIELQYSEGNERFSLPENLYIIGTMNTADRSIARVDLALRRRFYFVEFHPADKEIGSVLREYLATNAPDMGWVADVVDKANEQLQQDERDAAIGPSYFMKENLNEGDVEIRWQHSVMPYIRELLFGQDSRIADFDLGKLRGNAPAPQSAPTEEDVDSDNVANA